MSKSAEEGTEKKKVKLDETAKKQGTKQKKERLETEEMERKDENMRQSTKEVRSVTEDKIQWDSSSQREGAEIGCPCRKGRKGCDEKDLSTPQQSISLPCSTQESKFPLPVPQLQWSDEFCEYWCISWWHSALEGFFGLFKHYKLSDIKRMFNLKLEETVHAITVSLGSSCLWGPLSIPWVHTIFPIWSVTHSVCRMDLLWGMFSWKGYLHNLCLIHSKTW